MPLSALLDAQDSQIRVGVIGAGVFGSQLVERVEQVPGMTTAGVADIVEKKAEEALRAAGISTRKISAFESVGAANTAYENGTRAVLDDGAALATTNVDVVVTATGIPEVDARHAFEAISNAKHVVMASKETDILVGPLLGTLAENRGVIYTMAYGDQPALMVELHDWARAVGFEVVATGRTTSDPDRHVMPDDAYEKIGEGDRAYYDKYGPPSSSGITASIDGTKTAVEACAAANALDLKPDETGMHVPTAGLDDLPNVFRPEDDGGILRDTGVVDAVVSDDPFSVFVVTTTENEKLRDYLSLRYPEMIPTSEDGKYQAFYRPYHFAAETTVTIASAALRNEATGTAHQQATDVVGVAKRDLEPDDELDASGRNVYGEIIDGHVARSADYVPLGLLGGAEVVRPIPVDDIVSYDDVEVQRDSFLYSLRSLQDHLE